MTEARLKLGQQREAAPAACPNRLGMRVLERNLRTPVVEFDLVARHNRLLILVEAKTQGGNDFGFPAEAAG
jgi:putative endonuclease